MNNTINNVGAYRPAFGLNFAYGKVKTGLTEASQLAGFATGLSKQPKQLTAIEGSIVDNAIKEAATYVEGLKPTYGHASSRFDVLSGESLPQPAAHINLSGDTMYLSMKKGETSLVSKEKLDLKGASQESIIDYLINAATSLSGKYKA